MPCFRCGSDVLKGLGCKVCGNDTPEKVTLDTLQRIEAKLDKILDLQQDERVPSRLHGDPRHNQPGPSDSREE